ncbi:anti-sigma factor [Catelliglobosispora koreensis]|uniref:anti-sigma factor n=1 Tax=Catelliglobosispora koreensis TaxID=129052 RepID=UPI00037E5EE3|nr:anti-sigma factor [Catelliglobosispora koreensis]
MSTIDVHTLSGAYVLHALDPREERAFTKHVTTCTSCAIEVAELSEAVTRLADDTWAIAPARLRAQVMREVRRVRQHAPTVAAQRHRGWQWLVRQWQWIPRPALAAALAAVVFAATGATVSFAVQARHARTQLAAAQADTAQTLAILTAPGTSIRTTTVTGGGSLSVAGSPHQPQILIMLAAAEPPPGKVYQLWTIIGGTPVSAGVLQPGQHTLTAITAARTGTIVGVTLEPPGGSPTPTLPIAAQIPAA